MTKGLFTSTEEISFQYNYVWGKAEKAYDPNTRRNPAEAKKICSGQRRGKVSKAFVGKIRH